MTQSKKKKSGFTMVELLVVVGLMVLVTTIVVSSAFGITRGASFTSARNTVFNLLEYAHQRACMDGKQVVFCIYEYAPANADKTYSVALFERAGVLTANAEGSIVSDKYNFPRNVADVKGRAIWNITQGKPATVTYASRNKAKTEKIPGTEVDVTYERVEYTLGGASGWKIGDVYGFEVTDRQDFPRGFDVDVSGMENNNDVKFVTYEPDGTVKNAAKITLTEAISGKKIEISISNDGNVTAK